MASRREREQKQRRKESAKEMAKKESQGSASNAVSLPEGIKLYKLEEGKHRIDIMPFIAGDNYPSGRGGADPGYEVSRMTYEQHRFAQPDGNFASFVCTYGTWGEPCLVCQHRNNPGLSQEEKDALRPQRRHLFLVNDKPGDQKNALKVLNTVHFNRKLGFGEQLLTAIESLDEDCFIADLKDGKTVQFVVADAKYAQVSRIDLLDRKHAYPGYSIEDAPQLDQCVLRPKKADILKALGIEDQDQEYEGSTPSDDDEDDEDSSAVKGILKRGDYVGYRDQECEVIRISSDGSTLTLETEDGDTFRNVPLGKVKPLEDPDDEDEEEPEEEDDEGEDEESGDEDGEDPDDEDSEEPEPVSRKKKPRR